MGEEFNEESDEVEPRMRGGNSKEVEEEEELRDKIGALEIEVEEGEEG